METVNFTELYTYEVYTNITTTSAAEVSDVMKILQMIIAIVGIIGNFTVVFAFLNHKQLRKKIPNMFIINQVSQLFFNLLLLIFSTKEMLGAVILMYSPVEFFLNIFTEFSDKNVIF